MFACCALKIMEELSLIIWDSLVEYLFVVLVKFIGYGYSHWVSRCLILCRSLSFELLLGLICNRTASFVY